MKIIFMGTPQFSCPTLQKILDDKNFEIVGVLTRQPQIAGRGQQLKNSPIHDLALKNNLKVFTPQSLKSQDIFENLNKLNADIGVVVAYGLILPIEILSLPKFGCINLHPSSLPRWRGASPIQRTIFAGDKTTSVDIIQMDQGLDSGNILYRKQINLTGDETYSNLANQLSEIGANAVLDTLRIFQNGDLSKFNLIKQDHEQAIYAHKISKDECKINWQNNAQDIYRQVKALSGSLGSYFLYKNEKIKILDAELVNIDSQQFASGTIINQDFLIQCNKGIIKPLILQRQGKKALIIDEFLRGFSEDFCLTILN
jgi:methionyl-tRNA formyltransferase